MRGDWLWFASIVLAPCLPGVGDASGNECHLVGVRWQQTLGGGEAGSMRDLAMIRDFSVISLFLTDR